MPNRYIRDGLISSAPFNALSWRDQGFYVRLLLVIDDFGCYDASPAILRAVLYPLLLDKMSTADVASSLANCEKAGLVSTYDVDGKPYLHVPKFKQYIRAKHRKWPAPPPPASPVQCTCTAHALHMQSYNDNPPTVATGNKNSPAKQERSVHTPMPPPAPMPPQPKLSRSPKLSEHERSWIAAMCQTRPVLAAMPVLPPPVLSAALSAAAAIPDAPRYAPQLTRYYAAKDKDAPYPPYYRPTSYQKMFADLQDVLAWALKWCARQDAAAYEREKRLAAAAAAAAAKKAADQQDPPLSREESLAFIRRLQKKFNPKTPSQNQP